VSVLWLAKRTFAGAFLYVISALAIREEIGLDMPIEVMTKKEKTLSRIMTIRKVVIDEEAPMHNGGR